MDPDFVDALRSFDKAERKQIGGLISDVCEQFGFPHAHRGLGLRDLGKGFYECRHGLDQRIVFQKTSSGLYFHFMGNHTQVTRFLKRQR